MVTFLLNTNAGKGKPLAAKPFICKIMHERHIPYTIFESSTEEEGAHFLNTLDKNLVTAVIVVGGDGTIQKAVHCLQNNPSGIIPLGIIPLGSCNDFIKSLVTEAPRAKKVADIVGFYLPNMLDHLHTPSYIDMLRANDTFFINVGSIGIDAEVAETAQSFKRYLGTFSYVAALLKLIFKFKSFPIHMTVDGRKMKTSVILVALANGRQYGNRFVMAPHANLADGLIDLYYIKRMSGWKILLFFPTVLLGKHESMKEVKRIRCKQVVFHKIKRKLNLDGNIVTFKGDITFEILPSAMPVLYGRPTL